MKLLTVVGARPEWIKHAALTRHLSEHDEVLVNTGQHYDDNLSTQFIRELGIPSPDYNLASGSGSHATQTANLLVGLERTILKVSPDVVIVYGDTNTTLAAALAASKLNVPVAHVEAGLRSFDRTMPEEINRIVVDHLSTYLFAPTDAARFSLVNEGIGHKAHMVGDVMADTLDLFFDKAKASQVLDVWGLEPRGYHVLTIHRQSNSNLSALDNIFAGIDQSDKPVMFPAHPRLRFYLDKVKLPSHIRIIEPQGYLDMIKLMSNADKVITDSGGMQKEAHILGVPCITLRDNTEWRETLSGGWNVLVGNDSDAIADAVNNMPRPDVRAVFYPRGACVKIANVLRRV